MFSNWDTVYLNLTVHVTWVSLSSLPNVMTLIKKYSQKSSLQLSCPRKRIPRPTWTAFKSFQQIGTQISILQEEATATPAQALGLRWSKPRPSQRTTVQVSTWEAHQIKTHTKNVNIEFSNSDWYPVLLPSLLHVSIEWPLCHRRQVQCPVCLRFCALCLSNRKS